MSAYYNEIDQFAAQWLRNLIKEGLIADGVVDDRDIRDVVPDDLAEFTQCHFFAGIGGWSYALRLAGWPDDRPVWTGSCPCQPFSAAGRGSRFADERHLWPHLHWLIEKRRPVQFLGEQVASKDGLAWFDLVQADLEGSGYAVGASDLCAAGVGAPHIRQRLWFVANADGGDACAEGLQRSRQHGQQPQDGGAVQLGNADNARPQIRSIQTFEQGAIRFQGSAFVEAEPVRGRWAGADWIWCRDGKYRPVEPGTFPLAHGIPCRVGRLRAYGNAIVPQVAAEFVIAATA